MAPSTYVGRNRESPRGLMMSRKNDKLNGSTALIPPAPAPLKPPASEVSTNASALGVQRGMQVGGALEKMARDYLTTCRGYVVTAATEMADDGHAAEGEAFLAAFDETIAAC